MYSSFLSFQLSTLHLVSEAFAECTYVNPIITGSSYPDHPIAVRSYSRYDPNRGNYWEFPNEKSPKDVPVSQLQLGDPGEIQRRRVDNLLSDLLKKFPPKAFAKKVV